MISFFMRAGYAERDSLAAAWEKTAPTFFPSAFFFQLQPQVQGWEGDSFPERTMLEPPPESK